MAGWILGCMLLYACWFFLCLARDKPKLIVKFFYWLAWIGAIGFGFWSAQSIEWARQMFGINRGSMGMLGLRWFGFWFAFSFGCIPIISRRILLNLYQDYEDETKVKWVPPIFRKISKKNREIGLLFVCIFVISFILLMLFATLKSWKVI